MRSKALAALVLVVAAWAGCVAPPGDPAVDPTGANFANPWERGLKDWVDTPATAPRRSQDDRLANVAPPGDPRFAAFDAVMGSFMTAEGIPAASVAVLRNGQLRYENAYGHLDEAGTKKAEPSSMFRLASVTKPMTAAVVTTLVEQGLVAYDDPVFCVPPSPRPGCLLPIEPHPTRPVADERLADLTLRDVIDHRVGWVRGSGCDDPFWDGRPIEIARTFGIPTPPPPWRLAQWVMGIPLDFDPGTDPGPQYDTYCNMGYTLLGLVAEAATGATIGALYDAYVFRPLEVSGDIEPGRTLPEERNPREPFYACDLGKAQSVFDPSQEVCLPDGTFDLGGAMAAGGLVGTAAAVGAVYEVFANDGSERSPGALPEAGGHLGGIPGTATTAWRVNLGPPSGADLQVVVLFNRLYSHDDALMPAMGNEMRQVPGIAGFGLNYGFQVLLANLLAAYEGAEAPVPAMAAPRAEGPAAGPRDGAH